jgi:hypothetical protein
LHRASRLRGTGQVLHRLAVPFDGAGQLADLADVRAPGFGVAALQKPGGRLPLTDGVLLDRLDRAIGLLADGLLPKLAAGRSQTDLRQTGGAGVRLGLFYSRQKRWKLAVAVLLLPPLRQPAAQGGDADTSVLGRVLAGVTVAQGEQQALAGLVGELRRSADRGNVRLPWAGFASRAAWEAATALPSFQFYPTPSDPAPDAGVGEVEAVRRTFAFWPAEFQAR